MQSYVLSRTVTKVYSHLSLRARGLGNPRQTTPVFLILSQLAFGLRHQFIRGRSWSVERGRGCLGHGAHDAGPDDGRDDRQGHGKLPERCEIGPIALTLGQEVWK